MYPSIKLFIVFVIILVFLQASSEAFGKTTVAIVNSLPGAPLLTVHCQSKDDDLGFHQIHGGFMWEFSFKPSFFDTTLFFCSFRWPGASHHFDIYVEERDVERCGFCIWNVKPDGPCFRNSECEKWNP